MLEDDAVFESGRQVTLAAAGQKIGNDSKRDAEIEFFRRQHGRCVAKFRGIDSISEAEKYIGFEIKIPADQLPVPKKGWFYTFQLKGCQVFTVDGEFIGIVTDIIDAGGTEILQVNHENQETLIPFAELYLKMIDPDQRRIEVDLPEGLRNLNK
jgi:16S rRNA processing protein RimM